MLPPTCFFVQDVGFHRPGSLRLLTTPSRVDEGKYMLQRQGWHQAPMWMISPEEIEKQLPFMKLDDVLGGLFTPGMFASQDYLIHQSFCRYNFCFSKEFVYSLNAEEPLNTARLIQAVQPCSFLMMGSHLVILFSFPPGIIESWQVLTLHFW